MEKSTKITLYSASILMFVVYVLSVIRGGFANTGSGFPVPDTGLTPIGEDICAALGLDDTVFNLYCVRRRGDNTHKSS